VTQVVVGEQQALFGSVSPGNAPQLAAEQIFEEQLFAQPDRHRHAERLESARRKSKVGFQQPLEFQERLVVEDDVVDFIERALALPQAVGERIAREPGIVFLAAEALFLRGGHDFAVANERRRAVVVIGGDAEDAHATGARSRPRTGYR